MRAGPSWPRAAARAVPSCRPESAAAQDVGRAALLPRHARLTRSDDFTEVVRRGRRAGRSLLTVHVLLPADDGPAPGSAPSPRVGLVVGRSVGGSVLRSRTSRRLRHLLRDRLPDLPPGSRLVVRAAPAAGTAPSAALGADLDAALARLRRGPAA